MSGFKAMVKADLKSVFLNEKEFAELHTIVYDGKTYEDIPVVVTGIKEQERKLLVSDHGGKVRGLYLVTTVVHVSLDDMNGVIPEKGMRFKINEGSFFREYRVGSSNCDAGMLRIELEAIDE